jgi:nitrogen regulatory protein P-II 1
MEVRIMKKIEAIIRPCKLEELKEALLAIDLDGITITQVMGAGKQKGWKEYYRGNEVSLNVLPKVKLELVSTDEKVDLITETIIKYSQTGEVGDGKIFISELQDCIRIRTRERGDAAI